ncbi:MAG: IPExxxVDY family protein [Bacteroidales bacterium]
MKSGAKIKRIQLKDNQISNSALIGIVSTEPDYKLSLALNHKLKISLKNDSPVLIIEASGVEMAFSRFSDTSAAPDISYTLTSNRAGKNSLLKKLKNIDFIFQIHNPGNEDAVRTTSSKLKEMECITAVFRIDPVSVKDKNIQYIIQ